MILIFISLGHQQRELNSECSDTVLGEDGLCYRIDLGKTEHQQWTTQETEVGYKSHSRLELDS